MDPEIISLVLSIVTAVAAIVAIIISVTQICISNKQSLLDRRLKIYLTVKWMKALCDEHKNIPNDYLSDSRDEPIYTVDLFFIWMTNSSFLEEIQPSIHHILEGEWHRKYLLKIEELRNMCEEARLVFPGRIGFPLADFIYYYEEMLVSMYKYQIAIKEISKESSDNKVPFPKNNTLENGCRKTMVNRIKGTFDLAIRLDNDGVLEKAKNKIKL